MADIFTGMRALAHMERELGPEAHEASAWVAKGYTLASRMMGRRNIDVLVAFVRSGVTSHP
jgi:hypothetical protein